MAMKVLVIDDEEKLRANLTIYLEMNGFTVIQAIDGEEGLERLKNDKPDIIISDVMMPGMDGYTMLKEIRAKMEYDSVPIIMLTAKESISDLYELEGANEFIPKPFEMSVVLDTINKYASPN